MLLELKVIIVTLLILPFFTAKLLFDVFLELLTVPGELYDQIKLTAILVEMQKNKDKL
jgi:hypothetical protein